MDQPLRFFAVCTCLLLAFGCDSSTPSTTAPSPGPSGGTSTVMVELCDNRDNDGDGKIDEGGLERACSSRCESSIERCVNGRWGGCPARQPVNEVCDNQDNDCDGLIDEKLTRECDAPCGKGTDTCTYGMWTCVGQQDIEVETCDNIDNDCDGKVDENLLTACESDCSTGYEVCVAGQYRECDAREPASETCGDAQDNDCDDKVDEGCDCSPGDTQECSTNLGVCTKGAQTCREKWNLERLSRPGDERGHKPGDLPELCNGVDDDCNGLTDDVPSAPCGVNTIGACQNGVYFAVMALPSAKEKSGQYRRSAILRIMIATARQTRALKMGLTESPTYLEPNPNREGAEDLRVMAEDARDPRVLAGTLYPAGDEDWYTIRVEDQRSWCALDGLPDNSFEVTVTLSNVPEGTNYEMCVHFSRDRDVIDEGCFQENILGEGAICTNGPADGPQSVSYLRRGLCGIDDSIHAYIRVYAPAGSPSSSCAPYTLSIKSKQFGRLETP